MLFKIPEIKSTPLLNDLGKTREELSEVVQQFEVAVDALEHSSWNDTEIFVKFGRLKDHTLSQLEFIKRRRVDRDIKFLNIERDHATRLHKPEDTQVFSETRAFLKSLNDKDRQEKLKHALDARNTLIIQAAMHWPHFLTGLTEEAHVTFCEQAREVLSRGRLAEIDAAERELNKLSQTLDKAICYVNDHKIEEDQVA